MKVYLVVWELCDNPDFQFEAVKVFCDNLEARTWVAKKERENPNDRGDYYIQEMNLI